MALGLNEHGEVVGVSFGGQGALRAFLWSDASGMIDLGEGEANGLSDFGDIVGRSVGRAVLWEPVGTGWILVELPPFEEPVNSGRYNDGAWGVDPFGQFIAGSSRPDLGGVIPVLWRRQGTDWAIVNLPTTDGTGPGTGTGFAVAVNSAGVAVGLSPTFFPNIPNSTNRAVVWRPGPGGYSVEILPPAEAVVSYAGSINENGIVTGYVGEDVDGNGPRVGVVWSPTPSGGWRVDSIGPDEAFDINAAGLVVGEISEVGQFFQEAWIWSEAIGLMSLGPGAARAVNDRNEVIGSDEDFNAVIWKLTQP